MKPSPSPTPTTKTPLIPDPATFFGDLAQQWNLETWLPRLGWTAGILILLTTLMNLGFGLRFWSALARAAVTRNAELARSAFQAARISRRWGRVAQHLKLVLTDRTAVTAAQTHGTTTTVAGVAPKPKTVVPRIVIRPDDYGVVCTVKTLPGVGLQEFEKAARFLADEWNAVRVSVTQIKPGRLRVRAVRTDPLTIPTLFDPDPATLPALDDISSIEMGIDEYGEAVRLRLNGVSGMVIVGLPGAGKSSFLNSLITRLGPTPKVLFVGLDGKTDVPLEGDFGDVAHRFSILGGDDLEEANRILKELVEFGRARKRSLRTVLGRRNVWHDGGPTADWPLVILIIDEAHTFFEIVKDGGNPKLKQRNILATENAQMVQELIKKRRDVGFLTILATQKGTGDAIPTYIRDVCSNSLAYACRTIEAAVAGLGEGIRDYPDCNPVALQGEQYIGVAVMALQNRPGYVRIRTPYVPEATAAAVAELHRGLVPQRGSLPKAPAPPAITAFDDEDEED